VVVVVLHIVAVGGILVFEVFKPEGRSSAAFGDNSNGLMVNDPREAGDSVPEGVRVGDPRAAGLTPYIVRAGDSVRSIADKHGLSTETIERQNDLDRGGRIFPGKQLFIPKSDVVSKEAIGALVAGSAGASGATTGTLKAVKESHLQASLNPGIPAVPTVKGPVESQRQPDVADTQGLPQAPALPAPPAPKDEPEASNPRFAVTDPPSTAQSSDAPKILPVSGRDGGVHVLARGETPYGIARRYGVNVQQLLKANGISDPTKLQIGQQLKIPSRR